MKPFVRIVDIETSGLPEDEQHAICEMGWVDLDLETGTIGKPVTFFVNPGHSIPAHIRAVHHISDQMVAGAMMPDQAVALLLKDVGEGCYLAAHRASFEQSFIDAGDRQWICTWKCALRAWQEAVSHSNQSLRYALDLEAEPDFDSAAAMPPHRALPDALVTAFILRKLLALRPVERLVEISADIPLTVHIGFGKHKGMKWAEVPDDYLRWIADKSDMDAETKAQAKHWLTKRAA
jgi:exodeoxyribonuclease X